MADFDPSSATAIEEPQQQEFDPSTASAVQEQPSLAQDIGRAAVGAVTGLVKPFIPTSIGQIPSVVGNVAKMLLYSPIQEAPAAIAEPFKVAGGLMHGEGLRQAEAEANPEIPFTGTREQKLEFGIGQGLQGALVAGGMLHQIPALRETIFGKAEPSISQPSEPVQSETATVNQETANGEPTEAQIEGINRELLPTTEPPSATAESFPSILRSSEEQRRVEQQQEPATQIRQPLSLDEMRLMRERNDLLGQKDMLTRFNVPEQLHAGLDERLGQIDDELTKIANRELQTEGGGEIPSATQERPITENAPIEYQGVPQGSNIPEDVTQVREGQGGRASSSGGVQPTTQEPITSVPSEQSTAPTTAEPPTKAPAPSELTGESGIAERYAKQELGDDAVIPGEGKTWQEAANAGRDYINKGGDPRLPIRRALATGRVGADDVGIISAEYDRLGAEKRAALDAANGDPNDPTVVAAEEAQRAWRKEAQPVLTKASDALRAAQGSRTPSDVTTYSGLSDLVMDAHGPDYIPTPEERTALSKLATSNKKVVADADESFNKLADEAIKQSGSKRIMTDEEMGNSLSEKFKKAFKNCAL